LAGADGHQLHCPARDLFDTEPYRQGPDDDPLPLKVEYIRIDGKRYMIPEMTDSFGGTPERDVWDCAQST
jgi:hypothetical protein